MYMYRYQYACTVKLCHVLGMKTPCKPPKPTPPAFKKLGGKPPLTSPPPTPPSKLTVAPAASGNDGGDVYCDATSVKPAEQLVHVHSNTTSTPNESYDNNFDFNVRGRSPATAMHLQQHKRKSQSLPPDFDARNLQMSAHALNDTDDVYEEVEFKQTTATPSSSNNTAKAAGDIPKTAIVTPPPVERLRGPDNSPVRHNMSISPVNTTRNDGAAAVTPSSTGAELVRSHVTNDSELPSPDDSLDTLVSSPQRDSVSSDVSWSDRRRSVEHQYAEVADVVANSTSTPNHQRFASASTSSTQSDGNVYEPVDVAADARAAMTSGPTPPQQRRRHGSTPGDDEPSTPTPTLQQPVFDDETPSRKDNVGSSSVGLSRKPTTKKLTRKLTRKLSRKWTQKYGKSEKTEKLKQILRNYSTDSFDGEHSVHVNSIHVSVLTCTCTCTLICIQDMYMYNKETGANEIWFCYRQV